MSIFRKKPVVISAIQYLDDADRITEISDFVGDLIRVDYAQAPPVLKIDTLEGTMTAVPGDWIIRGVKGEFYPCKPDIFEATYDRASDGMSFGAAIETLREGKKIARAGWNGKNQWVVLMSALKLPPHSSQEPGAKVNDRTAKHIGVDTPLDSQPYFAIWNAQGKWQPGWVPSTSDALAEDWQTVE